MGRRAVIGIGAVIVTVAAVALPNYVFVQRHLSGVIHADARNGGISAFAHYKYFVIPSSVVFDLRNVSGKSSPADVTRVFLQFAETLKDSTFTEITLSHSGHQKFLLEGEYFKTLGTEYGTQNPVYTMRTFSENVHKLDGTAAFGSWTGGWLGVVGKQMEDFNEFHKQWYIADLAQNGQPLHTSGSPPTAAEFKH